VAHELAIKISLYDICHSEIRWYMDKSFASEAIDLSEVDHRTGIYILWHKDDYCPSHEKFHMRSLYAGKGLRSVRIKDHWKRKDTSTEMLIYYSFYACENRIAKYLEQLLLDTYDFPLNKSENRGNKKLCAYYFQSQVD
jgi:hypothetical protein